MTEKYIKLKIYSLDGGTSRLGSKVDTGELPILTSTQKGEFNPIPKHGWATEQSNPEANGVIYFPSHKMEEVEQFMKGDQNIIQISQFPKKQTDTTYSHTVHINDTDNPMFKKNEDGAYYFNTDNTDNSDTRVSVTFYKKEQRKQVTKMKDPEHNAIIMYNKGQEDLVSQIIQDYKMNYGAFYESTSGMNMPVTLPPGTDLTDFPLGKKTFLEGKDKITISLNSRISFRPPEYFVISDARHFILRMIQSYYMEWAFTNNKTILLQPYDKIVNMPDNQLSSMFTKEQLEKYSNAYKTRSRGSGLKDELMKIIYENLSVQPTRPSKPRKDSSPRGRGYESSSKKRGSRSKSRPRKEIRAQAPKGKAKGKRPDFRKGKNEEGSVESELEEYV